MTTILLICDDEKRRAELHELLMPEFKVFSADHFSANTIKRRLKKKEIIVVEAGNLNEIDNDKKISIYPINNKRKSEIKEVLSRVLKITKVNLFYILQNREMFNQHIQTMLHLRT